MESIIQIKGLRKSFGDKEILKGIDLEVNKGEVICIIGPSGSGKSTLLRCCNLLEYPNSGEILFKGENILNKKINLNKVRSKIGMVFQNFNLFNNKDVIDNCTLGPIKILKKDRKETEERALEILESVGMKDFAYANVNTLSGGQKQRVAIAGVLAMQPKILILDEATSMLDPKGKREIKALIKKMRDIIPDLTIISITHDIDEAISSDEVIVMNKGKLFKVGAPLEIFENEKELLDISLDLPFAYKLHHELDKLGIKLTKHIDSEGMVNELCPLSSEK